MPHDDQYLIISQSGRALAASAKRAGFKVHVIGRFSDEDMCAYALSQRTVTADHAGFDPETLLSAVHAYARVYPELKVVIGSGLENAPEVLVQIESCLPVFGNKTETIQQIKDPSYFFNQLARLRLPHPEFSTDKPLSGPSLVKQIGGVGGEHIRLYRQGLELTKENYMQALRFGKHYSAAFLADGYAFHLLGFSRTYVRAREYGDFTFAGAVSHPPLEHAVAQKVAGAIRKLVSLFKLKGLCGLDFILEPSGKYTILEVNPRPTATFELYEYGESLFNHHVMACQRQLLMPTKPNKKLARALAILYAPENLTVPGLRWPTWCTDRPKVGTYILKNHPVCTVFAEASNAKQARQEAAQRLALQSHQLIAAAKAA